MPMLYEELGHAYSYNLCVSEAAAKNGWEFIGLIPKGVMIPGLPKHWKKILANNNWEEKKSFFQRMQKFISNIFPLQKFFKEIKREESIFFLEHFTLLQVAALAVALLLRPAKIQLWLLHRYHCRGLKSKLYCFFHGFFAFLLGKDNVKLLTDSELLAKDQQVVFRKNVIVLPIPHGHLVTREKAKKNTDTFFFWWPGGSTRAAKGLHEIQTFAQQLKQKKHNVQLILADNLKELFGISSNYLYIPRVLQREEYEKWMNAAEIVLLPYDPVVYQFGTSGILVEAVIAGKMPFVRDGSWLAYELKRFGLDELIIDWTREDLLEHILAVHCNATVQKKLAEMRTSYASFHSLETYAAMLQNIKNRG